MYNTKQKAYSKNFALNLKDDLKKNVVWSVLSYGVESWTIKVNAMNKLEALEMWIYYRVLKYNMDWKNSKQGFKNE